VFFERGNANLLSSSYPELNRLVKLLKENPTLEIELGGHTDHAEWSEKNQQLSDDRWMSVKQYLVMKGINEIRITGKGYAGNKPIFPNDSEENRRKNRRVEFKITKM
jgi:outer membrane protein OmpA-like peptidoglycan-associated protein